MSSKRTGRALADVMGELDEEPAASPDRRNYGRCRPRSGQRIAGDRAG